MPASPRASPPLVDLFSVVLAVSDSFPAVLAASDLEPPAALSEDAVAAKERPRPRVTTPHIPAVVAEGALAVATATAVALAVSVAVGAGFALPRDDDLVLGASEFFFAAEGFLIVAEGAC